MNLSRRDFLRYTSFLAAGSFTCRSWTGPAPALSDFPEHETANDRILLLNSSCALNESLEGYKAALQAAHIPFELRNESCFPLPEREGGPRPALLPAGASRVRGAKAGERLSPGDSRELIPALFPNGVRTGMERRVRGKRANNTAALAAAAGSQGLKPQPQITTSAARLKPCPDTSPAAGYRETRLIIAPTASLTDLNEARWLRLRIEQGATALIESGGAYLSPSGFRVHASLLRSLFGVAVLPPANVWEQSTANRKVPYVQFRWPVPATIRDFSRVVSVTAREDEAVAVQAGRPVGMKRRLGAGTLIFLGSPVGPHLLSGDREAQQWLAAACRVPLDRHSA